jgi:glycosyltransferase involved in cell wall biosynthesis
MLLISVVIPLFNKQQSAERAIGSVLAQSYPHFELIVVDDGSTDQSLSVARTFTDPRMQILTQENFGVATARNRGVSVARGEYVCFLDADDEYGVEFLAEIHQLIQKHPQAALYSCRYKEVDELGAPFLGNCDLPEPFFGEVSNFFVHYKNSRSLICSSNICARKALIQHIGGFPDGQKIGEDIYVWLRLALLGPVMFSSRILSTVYRNAENRTISSGMRAVPYHTRFFLTDRLWRQQQQPETIEKLLQFIYHNSLINVCGALMANNKQVAIDYIQLIEPHRPSLSLLIKCLRWLPAKLFQLGKILRNLLTIRAIDGQ